MNQPVLSIDVSKSNSYAAAFMSYGQPFKKPIKFNHTIIRTQMHKWAEFSPAFPLFLSILGVGKLTAATIIGEIGDVNRFPTTKQLIAYAGLDPTVYQSGRFKASNNKISKLGSTYLRKSLYQATTAAIRKVKGKPNNPTLYDYYTKKRNEGKPYKVAVIATASKLLRIIYGVWKNNEKFIIK
ncbi:transposase [Selenihalanaerobacter shriftii]|uniref:Transposase IS116/IS110/IS902 family protein n=1 Tax=Selenihalanaerobacter shriftii TaxID=142842 RepID=A0A1T4NT45_9FIRM|nr:transposase [Selenihalanaerobacter shriftii]SJZ82404.1 Transposase IS116/IS110/IS902 family protein [Selenihalanaerobacter shriftii]